MNSASWIIYLNTRTTSYQVLLDFLVSYTSCWFLDQMVYL